MSRNLTLNNLEITGDISLTPLPDKYRFQEPYEVIMMMGPTGAGKSNFIEILGGRPDLGLSRDQLEGFTQKITAYELRNVKWKRREGPNTPETIYLLDTPGSADSKLSEMEIVLMVNDWMIAHQIRRIEGVIYACSITDTRVPGSKKKSIGVLQSITRIAANTNRTAVTIATTMWDNVEREAQIARANNRYAQLRDDIWKDLTDRGGLVMKFDNTQLSALTIIDSTLGDGSYFLALGGPVSMSSERDYVPNLYQDLLERINNARNAKERIEDDLKLPDAQADAELKAILEVQLQDTSDTLTKFERQLADFGDPPPGFGQISLQIPSEKLSRLGRLRQGYHLVKAKSKNLISREHH